MSWEGIITLDYGRPVALIRDWCWSCGDEDELEVCLVGEYNGDAAPCLEHEVRCVKTGFGALAFYTPAELAALVAGYREASA